MIISIVVNCRVAVKVPSLRISIEEGAQRHNKCIAPMLILLFPTKASPSPSQQRKPGSSHYQRGPNNLHPRPIRRRRPLGNLTRNARLGGPDARQVTHITRRHRADPTR